MSKLTLAALVSGLALSLASPVIVQAAMADADQPAKGPDSKKGVTPKADTRSEKSKAAGSVPSGDADAAAREAQAKKDRAAKPDSRSEKAKAAGSIPSGDADQPAKEPQSKKK